MSGKWLTYAGQALALVWALLWTLFGLMSGIGEGNEFADAVVHTVVPGLLFLLGAVLAWLWKPWGAIALVGLGVWAMVVYPFGRTVEGLLVMSLPPIVAAGLLLAGWWVESNRGVRGAV